MFSLHRSIIGLNSNALDRADRNLRRPKRALRPALGHRAEPLEDRKLLSKQGAMVQTRTYDGAGNTLQNARPVDLTGSADRFVLRDSIGGSDRLDFYRISLGSRAKVDLVLSGLKKNADLAIYTADGHLIGNSALPGKAIDAVSANLPAGTYYVSVAAGPKATKYALQFVTTALPNAPSAPSNTSSAGSSSNTGASPIGSVGTSNPTTPGTSNPTNPGNGNPGNSGGGSGGSSTPSPSAIPASGVYNIYVTGTTYYGSTSRLSSATQFYTSQSFATYGTMAITPTIDTTNASNNGLNGRDVGFNTGNIGVGGAGVFEYATNTALHRLWGGNSGQSSAVDMARVTTDTQSGRIRIEGDVNLARVSQLNTMFRSGGLLAMPFQIVAIIIDMRFTDGGRRVEGTITMAGEGYIEAGTAAISATFQGTLR